MKLMLVVGAALSVVAYAVPHTPAACKYPVYCNSNLLHHVQMARVFPDSKTFVDYQMRNDPNVTLAAFQELLDKTNNTPTKEQLKQFVDQYFISDSDLENWTPIDFVLVADLLDNIHDDELRIFADDIHNMWPLLGRKIKDDVFKNPQRYSIIPVSNGFIIPGGQFKEIYYWDTYWIIKGLLISGMLDTAQGMIQNLIELVRTVGHVPNGSRWYYQERSQPPMLVAMMSLYFQYFNDIEFLKKNIGALEEELNYWLDTKTVSFGKDNNTYKLLRYYAPSVGPRPESYFEDYTNSLNFDTTKRQQFFTELKSAAESGWDFSSRWFVDSNGKNTGNLLNTHTLNIIPVDLNAIFANALQNVSNFHRILFNKTRAAYWDSLAQQWRINIEQVFWNEKFGIWLDYDAVNQMHRNYFHPSNLAPLWMGVVAAKDIKSRAPRIIQYLHNSGVLNYHGGIPSSLLRTGEKWDFPNAWPPLMSIFVNALEALGTEESKNISFHIAQDWVRTSLSAYLNFDNQRIYDRYDAENPGQFGIAGEYTVQEGFGWSNGVILEFLAKYGDKNMTVPDSHLEYEISDFDTSVVIV